MFYITLYSKLGEANFGKEDDTMTLVEANIGEEYIIKNVATDDEELNSFLFSLGCYSGEPITVVSRKRRNCTVSIKDGRYNIDNELAAAITI
jgi:ferrous iron transport protein A